MTDGHAGWCSSLSPPLHLSLSLSLSLFPYLFLSLALFFSISLFSMCDIPLFYISPYLFLNLSGMFSLSLFLSFSPLFCLSCLLALLVSPLHMCGNCDMSKPDALVNLFSGHSTRLAADPTISLHPIPVSWSTFPLSYSSSTPSPPPPPLPPPPPPPPPPTRRRPTFTSTPPRRPSRL